jgi:hypothetical protein
MLVDTIDPAKAAMIVVDMQNDFVAAGAPTETAAARARERNDSFAPDPVDPQGEHGRPLRGIACRSSPEDSMTVLGRPDAGAVDLDGTLTQRMSNDPNLLALILAFERLVTQEEEPVNSNTVPSEHRGSLQQELLQSSLSDQQAATPLTKADLLIVAFVSSLWLWAATFAMTSAALR